MQGRVTLKKSCETDVKKKLKTFLQSTCELHRRVYKQTYKLYPPESQLGSNFILHTLYLAATLYLATCNFIGLQRKLGSHLYCSNFIMDNMYYTLVAKHSCRKPLMDNHGFKVIKKRVLYTAILLNSFAFKIPCFESLEI